MTHIRILLAYNPITILYSFILTATSHILKKICYNLVVERYTEDQIQDYSSALTKVAALSNLFSESKTPFIHYRATEYLYARAFDAKNLARSDIAIDAKLGNIGVGLKTFVYYGKPKYEKIAEFNKELLSFSTLSSNEKIKRISELRNDRITVAGRISDVDQFIYHCIARLPEKLYVFEQEMPYIDTEHIEITNVKGGTISFTDGQNKYRFNSSKSTLFKEFFSDTSLFEKPIEIYEDPFELLNTLKLVEKPTIIGASEQEYTERELIILPLYGYKNKEPFVFPKSGLNQWNADGRERNDNELYIPIPSEVREKYPDFLPSRDTPFDLHLPNGEVLNVKVSQADGKALMSNPNSALGKWLLRDILGLEVGTLATYELLENIGIDSVEISKKDGEFYIDFKQTGTYEQFIED